MQARAVTLQGQISGQIALGLCSDPDYLQITELLALMGRRFPKLNLNLPQSPSGVVLSKIHEKALDAGFVFSGNPYGDLDSIKLAEPEYLHRRCGPMERPARRSHTGSALRIHLAHPHLAQPVP